MNRPTVLDMDLVVVPREANATMWTAAAVPLERWRKETFFGSKNDAAVLSYRAALSTSPYPTAWDDVRKYVEGLERERDDADACLHEAIRHARNEGNAYREDEFGAPYVVNTRAEVAEARIAELEAALALSLNGNRGLPYSREYLGLFVREAWIRWAKTQPNPKPSWLVPYDELPEQDKEADRQIGEAVARWTLIGDAAARAYMEGK